MSRREQILWDPVQAIAEELERRYTLKGVCSVGVVLFSYLTEAEQQLWYQALKAGKIPTFGEIAARADEGAAAARQRAMSHNPANSDPGRPSSRRLGGKSA